MKKTILIAMIILATAFTATAQEEKTESKIKHLTYKEFQKQIWDFEKSPNTFVFKGKQPVIVDFCANWCRPCRQLAPIMEKLADEYDGKVTFYKIDVDEEKDLASVFQVRSIPTMLFIPMKGQPMKQVGLLPEENLRQIIEEQLIEKTK
jgi:thioredoxin